MDSTTSRALVGGWHEHSHVLYMEKCSCEDTWTCGLLVFTFCVEIPLMPGPISRALDERKVEFMHPVVPPWTEKRSTDSSVPSASGTPCF